MRSFHAVLSVLAVGSQLSAQTVQYQTVTRYEQRCEGGKCRIVAAQVRVPVTVPEAPKAAPAGGTDADPLAQVNARRTASGLRPFLRDEGLTRAAHAAASFRARALLFGHTDNDFRFLPAGARADGAGCAAYPAHMGFLSCCMYDQCTYAGAASVVGSDGRTYHHLFVSNTPSGPAPAAAKAPCDCGPGCDCPGGSCPTACPKPAPKAPAAAAEYWSIDGKLHRKVDGRFVPVDQPVLGPGPTTVVIPNPPAVPAAPAGPTYYLPAFGGNCPGGRCPAPAFGPRR